MQITNRLKLDIPQSTDAVSLGPNDFQEAFNILDAAGVVYEGVDTSRPQAGTYGRFWYSTDKNIAYFDTGGAWLLITTFFTGTIAARPTAGVAGRMYTATDQNNTTYYDNGAAWAIIQQGVVPISTSQTLVNGSYNVMGTNGLIVTLPSPSSGARITVVNPTSYLLTQIAFPLNTYVGAGGSYVTSVYFGVPGALTFYSDGTTWVNEGGPSVIDSGWVASWVTINSSIYSGGLYDPGPGSITNLQIHNLAGRLQGDWVSLTGQIVNANLDASPGPGDVIATLNPILTPIYAQSALMVPSYSNGLALNLAGQIYLTGTYNGALPVGNLHVIRYPLYG